MKEVDLNEDVIAKFDETRTITFATVTDALTFAAGVAQMSKKDKVFNDVYEQVYGEKPSNAKPLMQYRKEKERFAELLQTLKLSDGTPIMTAFAQPKQET